MNGGNSVIEINQEAFQSNLNFLRKLIGPDTLISLVVKGNAYGHGIENYVPMAHAQGVNHFSVFDDSEARRVKESVEGAVDVMIMGMINPDAMEWVVANGVSFFVFDESRLKLAIETARKLNVKARIHLELETGMNRTGFDRRALTKAVKLIDANTELIEIEGVCTHFAGAESIANYKRVQRQYKAFNRLCKTLADKGIKPRYRHTACSAAALSYPKSRMDLVRIGIAQYGYWPSKETFIQYLSKRKEVSDPLSPVISWKSNIMSVKQVRTGDFIGYGTTFLAEIDMKIAVVPVGYAHGYSRSLSNQGRVLVNGQRVGVVGLVNMNMMIVDVTSLSDVKPGDEVVLIGRQGDLAISVASFSEMSNQLNYEMLTRLPINIPRKVIE